MCQQEVCPKQKQPSHHPDEAVSHHCAVISAVTPQQKASPTFQNTEGCLQCWVLGENTFVGRFKESVFKNTSRGASEMEQEMDKGDYGQIKRPELNPKQSHWKERTDSRKLSFDTQINKCELKIFKNIIRTQKHSPSVSRKRKSSESLGCFCLSAWLFGKRRLASKQS